MHVINSVLPGRWLKILPIHVWICLCMCMTVPCRGQEARAVSVAVPDTATDHIVARIIFIGDAGRINADQQAVIRQASKEVIPGRTKVLFLGDNVFPAGFDGDNANDQTNGAATLSAACLPFRQLGAAVYFIPGEKDWDNGGPEGLNKVKQAAAFIAAKHDSLLAWLPPEGCPDPVLIPVTDQLVIIAMDSEWWLQQNKKDEKDAGSDCNCLSSQDITANLRELLYKNRYKTILLATHHPFASYGTHGGNFSWKDYIFPLTAVQKDLYLPIPVVGALYPALRKTFQGPQDLHHPLYTQMRQMVTEVFEGFPNLIHVSAHEEGLQFINNPKKELIQIISGGGSEAHYTTRGNGSLFAAASIGFVTLDQLSSGAISIRFLGQADKAQTKKSEKISVNPADTKATGSISEEGAGAIAVTPLVELFAYQYHPKPYRQLEKRHQEAMTADSLKLAVHPVYNQITGAHRFLFGDNYRSQWATPVQLPVIHVSEYAGGLHPVKLGGGFQSTSLRLADKDGKEYTLRSVEKRADLIVPEAFSGTFVKEWLDDATSAQHPYAALIVPPLANAVSVAHAVPIVGVVAPDSALAAYGALFDGKVNLLEAREPIGETDNTVKTIGKLQEDNDNNFDAKAFLRARGLDYLMSDWDRHEDQWRFHDTSKKGEPDYYIPVPRDRDMVLNVTEGLIPDIAKHFILMPRVFGFSSKDPLRGSNYYFYKSAFLNQHPSAQFNFDTWHKIAVDEQAALTDSVLTAALMQLPPEIRKIDYSALLDQLKNRRDHLTAAMDKYYRLTNKYVDIEASDKKELVTISDEKDQNALRVTLQKISKKGKIQDTLMSKTYPREMTKEIRLYLGRGDDSVIINNQQSTVGLRLIGGHGHKSYKVTSAHRKIRVYDHEREAYYGDTDRLKINVKADSAHTAFLRTNLYNTALPLLTGAYNADDGLFLGIGARVTLQNGFRKTPFTSQHQLMLSHAFATEAFRIKYSGQWTEAVGGADLTFDADIKAPDNTQNFFGRGNETRFDKTGKFKRYYRIRFNTVDLAPALRWDLKEQSSISLGPAFQYYHMDPIENEGRFIEQTALLQSYDSSTLYKDKIHLGLQAGFELDHRNNKVLPVWGTYLQVQLNVYKGLNAYSGSYAQLLPQIAVYKPLNNRHTLILSDRIGGGVTVGKAAFYQSVFLGGQGNLLGYRNYRFAGMHALYNNLELRWALADFGNYIVKGEFGLTGFYDVGRIWQPAEHSDKWHNGVGGGFYFAPAGLTVFKFNMGYSPEGWYPYFSMGIRF